MFMELEISKNTERNVWEVKPAGELDISSAEQFRNGLEASLSELKQDIELDLSGLSYIDSTGLGVIIGIYGRAKKEGFTLKLLNPRDNVKKLLNISGLEKILG